MQLAWKRLETAQNIFYKNYYRKLFSAYDLTLKDNLDILSDRLQGNSYKTSKVLKIYLPKSSGLHRPITFLQLDDLVVYQAMANVIAEKFSNKRAEVENNTVFSNILNPIKDKNIYFFEKWQDGYKKFLIKIKDYFKKGNIWVAYFDIAAYYDTISHDVLRKQIARQGAYEKFKDSLQEYLRNWTINTTRKISHGIPQGPIASNLIAEIYLLPVDLKLKEKKIQYVRYVDDIRIFGKTKEEVLRGVILLDRECRKIGLIPQSKKYKIVKAEKVDDAIGKFPSLTMSDKNKIFSNSIEVSEDFEKAFKEENFDVSKVKYILKSSPKNNGILRTVLKNLNQHPELVNEFYFFLFQYRDEDNVGKSIYEQALKKPSPYEFVEGRYWELLGYFNLPDSTKNKYISFAIKELKNSGKDKPALRLGLYKFIASTGNCLICKWLINELKYPFIQMSVVPSINSDIYSRNVL